MPEPDDIMYIDDLETLEMLADPMRVEVIEQLTEPASVSQIAEAMDVPRTRLYHHVKLLEDAGLIRVVETRQRGAIPEKIYQAAAKNFAPSKTFRENTSPVELVGAIADSVFAVTRADITRSMAERRTRLDNDPDRPSFNLKRSVVRLSGERLGELITELEALLSRFEGDADGEPVAIVTVVYPSSRSAA